MSAVAGPRGIAGLTLELARARLAAGGGERLLYAAAVVATTTSSAIAFMLAGGTWMFHRRNVAPTGLLAQVVREDPGFSIVLGLYVGLAGLACALVLPALVSLVASGAQLGARGRERRLAALRLVGLSSRDVTTMALVDALVQGVVGVVLGYACYLASLPAWARMSFQAVPVRAGEMLLPWWQAVALAVALVGLTLVATAVGLRRVRVSPLGVARRAGRPALRGWRLLVLVAVVVAASFVAPASMSGRTGLALMAVVVLGVVAGIDVAGPWFLQLFARPLTAAPSVAVATAARRVVAGPQATWRRVSTLGVLAFVGGYLACVPFSYDPATHTSRAQATFMQGAQADFLHGAVITLALGFTLTAVSLLIRQASATIERAEQSRALHRLGAPMGFELRVMWVETFAPMVVGVGLAAALGVAMGTPMATMVRRAGLDQGSDPWPVVLVILTGLAVAAAALVASHPLHRRLLTADAPRSE